MLLGGAEEVTAQRPQHMPGEPGIWLFIAGDLIVFTLFFSCFLFYRAQAIDIFTLGHAHLNQHLGALNTVFMLTSSWFVATGVRAARRQRARTTSALLVCALLCGAGFIVTKYVEYSAKISQGMTLVSDDFFMFYYMLTGIHLMHVLIGMSVLSVLARSTMAGGIDARQLRNLESGASFWHLVDLLWIVLFALLYLIP